MMPAGGWGISHCTNLDNGDEKKNESIFNRSLWLMILRVREHLKGFALKKKTYWVDFSDFYHNLLLLSAGCRSWKMIGEDCCYDICNLSEGQSMGRKWGNWAY